MATFEMEVVGADAGRHGLRIDCAVTERDSAGAPSRISGVTVDVTAAKRAGEALRAEVAQRKRSEERQQMLVHELNHRVKNMLSTVQSIARQSLGQSDFGEGAREFEERLMALAWAYEILTREHWVGASLREVIQRTLAPHAGRASSRLALEGPHLWLSPNRALSFALAIHELATNAVKYGALSNDEGRVEVCWRIVEDGDTRGLELEWAERGGPRCAPAGPARLRLAPDRAQSGARARRRSDPGVRSRRRPRCPHQRPADGSGRLAPGARRSASSPRRRGAGRGPCAGFRRTRRRDPSRPPPHRRPGRTSCRPSPMR